MSFISRFSIGFNWQRSIHLAEYPSLDREKIKLIIDDELKYRNLVTDITAEGIDFKMSAGKTSSIISPGGSRIPFLRKGNFSFTEKDQLLEIKCRNIVLTGFFMIITLIVFIQCYIYYWFNRENFAPWTLVVPPALLLLYFLYYAIFTRIALNAIWKKVLKHS